MTKAIELLQINTDGGSRGNPGPAAIGVYAHDGKDIVFTLAETIGIATNNVAEYTAVIRALENIEELNIHTEKIRFVLDSELIVHQITGKYKIKQPHLLELYKKIADLVNSLKKNGKIKLLSFTVVRREFNKDADSLVNEALDG